MKKLFAIIVGMTALPITVATRYECEFPDSSYVDAVRRYFNGEVIVGRDSMVL